MNKPVRVFVVIHLPGFGLSRLEACALPRPLVPRSAQDTSATSCAAYPCLRSSPHYNGRLEAIHVTCGSHVMQLAYLERPDAFSFYQVELLLQCTCYFLLRHVVLYSKERHAVDHVLAPAACNLVPRFNNNGVTSAYRIIGKMPEPSWLDQHHFRD